MAITNEHIFETVNALRLEIKKDMRDLRKDIDINTAFRNNLSGKIAVGVMTIGAFVSAATAIIVTFINNKLLGK